MFIEELRKIAEQSNITFNDEQLKQFEHFYKLVIDWNQKINLTAITEPRDFMIKHIIDSISLWNDDKFSEVKTIIDVGTGAGFPGIPLKIYRPEIKITLLDSLAKRVKFLTTTIEELQLKNIVAIHSRAEDAADNPKYREAFDLSVSRAVAKLNVLAEYCIPFVKIEGFFVALKGGNVEEEMNESKNAIKILGGSEIERVDIKLINGDSRNLIYIKKTSKTPNKFPRKAGMPEKKPLL